jgi:glutamate-1-semialdehyde 2,1-aminomutase
MAVLTLLTNKSAFSPFFYDELPKDLHDVMENHYFEFDTRYRLELIKWGVYHIPIPCKQGSVSYSHTEDDINRTLKITREALKVL